MHNVSDRRHGWIGSWEVEPRPIDYDKLGLDALGRTAIYQAHGKVEAGTITSWRGGLIFVRFGQGDTSAACKPGDLVLAVKPLDGDLDR